MNAPLPASLRFDIHGLSQAIAHCNASDALRCQFNQSHQDILVSYVQPFALNSGQVLMEQGALDRILYFIESGTLSVHYEDEKARVRIALGGPGTVLGEGAFFSHLARSHGQAALQPPQARRVDLTTSAIWLAYFAPISDCRMSIEHGVLSPMSEFSRDLIPRKGILGSKRFNSRVERYASNRKRLIKLKIKRVYVDQGRAFL